MKASLQHTHLFSSFLSEQIVFIYVTWELRSCCCKTPKQISAKGGYSCA